MKKPFIILWLAGILVLCFPLSYLVNVKTNTYSRDFNILIPVCAMVAFLLIGGISWLAYYFMKKNNRGTAVRDALLVFTGLVVGVSAVSAPEAAKKMRHRQQFLNENKADKTNSSVEKYDIDQAKNTVLTPAEREEAFQSCMEESMNSMGSLLDMQEIPDKEERIKNYCNCMLDKMSADPELVQFIEAASEEEMDKNTKLNAIVNECMLELGIDLSAISE